MTSSFGGSANLVWNCPHGTADWGLSIFADEILYDVAWTPDAEGGFGADGSVYKSDQDVQLDYTYRLEPIDEGGARTGEQVRLPARG